MIHSNDIALQLLTISLSSDLKTGTKFAAFHTFGKQPLSSCLLNRVQRGMDKDFEHSSTDEMLFHLVHEIWQCSADLEIP